MDRCASVVLVSKFEQAIKAIPGWRVHDDELLRAVVRGGSGGGPVRRAESYHSQQ